MTKSYSRLDLKIIAICSMFLDHGMKLFAYPIKAMLYSVTQQVAVTEILFLLLIGFGRVAFLLFGFQIAEGVRYTHDIQGYWKRLAIFALLSEIPYQMMVSSIQTGEILVQFCFQNVFMTLLLGAVACGLFRQMMQRCNVQMAGVAVFACIAMAFLLHTDYGGMGVLYIFLCYLAPKKSVWYGILLLYGVWFPLEYLSMVLTGQMSLYMAVVSVGVYFANAMLAWAIIKHYHGQKGKQVHLYFFYVFYPLHILILIGLQRIYMVF